MPVAVYLSAFLEGGKPIPIPFPYENNPGFLRFIDETGLPFKPMTAFHATEMEDRSQLYLRLAEHIWNPDRLTETAAT